MQQKDKLLDDNSKMIVRETHISLLRPLININCWKLAIILCPHGLGPPGSSGVRLVRTWVRMSVRPKTRLRFLAKVESQDILMAASWYFISYEVIPLWDQQEYTRAMTSWPIFHSRLSSDFGQIIKVKIFVQGRSSKPINGSKLIFYETSRNIH